MGKEFNNFTEVPGYDEIGEDDKVLNQRRIETYSAQALKAGIPVDNIVVLHTWFSGGLKALDRVFQISREVSMPHGVCIAGTNGTGKSLLTQYFCESLPSSSLFAPGLGCIRMRLTASPTAGEIIASLLRVYKYPFTRVSEKAVYSRREILFDLVRQKGTRMICVDNAHYLLNEVRRRTNDWGEPNATALLGDLMDETRVGLLLAGDVGLKDLAVCSRSLADRMSVQIELPRFSADSIWQGLLNGFVKSCNWFDIGLITQPKQDKLLHIASDGNLRTLKRLLTEGVLVAAQRGGRSITQHDLEIAFSLVHGAASKRNNPYV